MVRSERLRRPPSIKIYEAFSAVGAERIKETSPNHGQVLSSDRTKVYDVYWSNDWQRAVSNDNGTFWQGYVGYPIVAMLLFHRRLEVDRDVLSLLADVNWKMLNLQYSNDY